MIRKVGLPAVISFLLFSASAALAQSPDDSAPIIDGRFDEWTAVAPIYSDAQGDGTGAVDFGRLWMKNDDRFVYFSFEASGEVSLETESGIVIGLDTDHDTSTGQPFESIGAELVWRFGERIGTFTSGGSSTNVAFQDLGLVSAPTVTSSVFEFCLELDAQPKRLGAAISPPIRSASCLPTDRPETDFPTQAPRLST